MGMRNVDERVALFRLFSKYLKKKKCSPGKEDGLVIVESADGLLRPSDAS